MVNTARACGAENISATRDRKNLNINILMRRHEGHRGVISPFSSLCRGVDLSLFFNTRWLRPAAAS